MDTKTIIARGILGFVAFIYAFGYLWFGALEYQDAAILVCGAMLAFLGGGAISIIKYSLVAIFFLVAVLGVSIDIYGFYSKENIYGASYPWLINTPYLLAAFVVMWSVNVNRVNKESGQPPNKSLKERDRASRAAP